MNQMRDKTHESMELAMNEVRSGYTALGEIQAGF